MHDPTTRWLINCIATSDCKQSLWFSDENVLQEMSSLAVSDRTPLLISNRWDVAARARARGFNVRFSDFDCSDIADNSQDKVFYRISKEKFVVHHILNQALRILKPNGELVLCGQKNEGIKTFIEKTRTLFNDEQPTRKEGNNYFTVLQKKAVFNNAQLLDNGDYSRLRAITELNNTTLYSKPGLFGWNKIDQGSALLISQLDTLVGNLQNAPQRLLDLGCGYGYLSIMTAHLPCASRVLTDNNAAALIAARYNCSANDIKAEVVAADAGDVLQPDFDLILCNPPFHQGFSVDGDLTDKFLAASKRLLAKNGVAVFVVNQFIPLERKAQGLFGHIQLLAQDKGFKVISLRR